MHNPCYALHHCILIMSRHPSVSDFVAPFKLVECISLSLNLSEQEYFLRLAFGVRPEFGIDRPLLADLTKGLPQNMLHLIITILRSRTQQA